MINAAIIGTGFSAKHHYNALRDRENVKIVGIWNRRYKVCPWANENVLYIGYGEELTGLLERADLVVLALPAGAQLDFVNHLAVHGGHTMILENPFGANIEGARCLRSALEAKDISLTSSYVPFVWRFHPDIKGLFDLVNEIGRIHMARFYDYVPVPFLQIENWATMLNLGGGLLANIGSHQIDLLGHFLPMTDICGGGTTLIFPREDGYRVTENGFSLGFIDSLKYQPTEKDGVRVPLTGDIGYANVLQGYSEVHGDISIVLQAGYGSTTPSKGIELHGEYGSATWHEHGTALHKDNRVIPIDRGPPPDLQALFNLFYDAMFSDDVSVPTAEDGFLTAVVINEIRKSWVYNSPKKQV